MAERGHSRDGKRDDPQIVFGLFKDNSADPATVAAQVVKLKERFGIEHLTCR